MKLSELINEYRIRAKDDIRPYFCKESELIGWFNEAEREAAIRAGLLIGSDKFNISAGETEISVPQHIVEIRHIELRFSGIVRQVSLTSRRVLDIDMPDWRTRNGIPTRAIHEDGLITLSSLPTGDMEVFIEYTRLPYSEMSSIEESPEIFSQHHIHLVDWVVYRAYSKQDADLFDPNKSIDAKSKFDKYFGKELTSSLRKRQNSNTPHRNRLVF